VSDGPLVSIVVPTRDRPDFLRWCLAAAAAQTDPDFEVIVCDNAVSTPVSDVVRAVDDARFRYLPPPDRPLSMTDNWERAVAAARGHYVAVTSDKMALDASAVAAMRSAASLDTEVLSWSNSAYQPINESRDLGPGYFLAAQQSAPSEYSLQAALERRLSFSVRRDRQGVDYFRGKIVFGAYRQDLLERIRDRAGRVFHRVTPDYTSMAVAAVVGDRGFDIGRPLVISFESTVSNGKRLIGDFRHAQAFLHESDPSGRSIHELPIPGVFASVHNLVAYDMVTATQAAGSDVGERALNRSNLALRAAEDLRLLGWRGAEARQERARQVELLSRWRSEHGIPAERPSLRFQVRERTRRALPSRGRLEHLAYIARGRTLRRFDSIAQAAAADPGETTG
jgi:Glycosyltransferase like family 2